MSNSLLKIKNLSTYTDNNVNLNNINFDLKSNEIHALVGERGVGKKIFIKVLAGIEKSIKGSIIFNNKDITSDLTMNYNNNIMFLLNKSMLADNLTIAENIVLMKEPQSILHFINRTKIINKTKSLLEELYININCRKYVYELSREQKKLIEIAKIYYYNPQIVILYDPTINLSLKSINLFYDIIKKLLQNGVSIIYITHKWEEALVVSNKISVLYEGTLAGTLTSKEAKNNPQKLLKMISGWNSINDNNNSSALEKESKEVVDAIFKAAEFLTSNYELKDVLKMLSNYACKIMNADGCKVYLIDEKTETIMDTVNNTSGDNRAKLHRNIVMEIMKNNSLYYRTIFDEDFSSLFKRLKNVETIICYPVLIRSNYTALIQIYYNRYYDYTKKQLRYLYTIARQAAIAIDNTRLMGKSTLIQESHHRIKNNLQTIISLLTMQRSFFKQNPDKSIDDLINTIIARIKSIAAVHDLLSKDEVGRSIVNIKKIVEVILDFYIVDNKPRIKLYLEDIFIPYNKATSISLVINELVNNCIKHAFSDFNKGVIKISCKIISECLIITIEDNGRGLPEKFDINNQKTLGLTIIKSIIKNEFNGNIEIFGTGGTTVRIHLPKESLLLTKG